MNRLKAQLLGFASASEDDFPEIKRWYHDKDVIMAAVESTNRAIPSIPPELINDRDIVITAVRNNDLALMYWSYKVRMYDIGGIDKNLCGDIEIAIEAVKQNPKAIKYVGDNLLNDPRILALIPKGS